MWTDCRIVCNTAERFGLDPQDFLVVTEFRAGSPCPLERYRDRHGVGHCGL